MSSLHRIIVIGVPHLLLIEIASSGVGTFISLPYYKVGL
jgi:hypothetical protein